MEGIGNFILQEILGIVISIFAPVILTALAGWLYQQFKLAKARIPVERLELVTGLINQLVLAAEQRGLTGALKNLGAEKKQYVIDRLEDELAKHNIYLDLDLIDDLIEAAVYDAINQYKEPKPVVEPEPVE